MNKKVLIIEDDKNLAESLKAVFSKKKLNVKISHSAQQAENLISLEQYDLLVVDVVLPKVSGINFLKKVLSKGLLHSGCKTWLISGVLDKKVISKDMVGHVDDFFKKPLNMNIMEKKINTLFVPSDNLSRNIKFFYFDYTDKKNILRDVEYIIKGHELMFICFYLCAIRFNGVLNISCHGTDETDKILLKDGYITSFQSINEQSYIEPLLVKNNLVSKEDIKKLLDEKSDMSLSDRLIAGCYISPHKMDKILREQQAIRLFEVMEHPSIVVGCVDFVSSMNFDRFVSLEMRHLLSLVYNWIHSKVNIDWLNEFFSNYREMRIIPLKKLSSGQRLSRYSGLEFLASDSIREPKTIGGIISESSKKEEDIVRELYCRLLVRENCFEYKISEHLSNDMDQSFMKKKYENFLRDAEMRNYFELLNLPVNASVHKIEEAYRNIVKIFHPDRRDSNMPKELAEICDRCFILIREIYQTLIDPKKKRKYLQILEEKSRKDYFEIKESYIKGKNNVEAGHYSQAVNQLEFVLKYKTAPGDTSLYYIWCLIKDKQFVINKEEINQIADLFDSVGLEYRQSALFFFVKGLFMKAKGEGKAAFNLFTQALRLDPRLSVARLEKYSLGTSKRKGKKSFMDFFRKGA